MSSTRFSDVHETDADAAQAHTTPSVRLDHAPRSGFGLRMHAVTRRPTTDRQCRATHQLAIGCPGMQDVTGRYQTARRRRWHAPRSDPCVRLPRSHVEQPGLGHSA
jgi:hypothetical protein